jgi:hypothetical protein
MVAWEILKRRNPRHVFAADLRTVCFALDGGTWTH